MSYNEVFKLLFSLLLIIFTPVIKNHDECSSRQTRTPNSTCSAAYQACW